MPRLFLAILLLAIILLATVFVISKLAYALAPPDGPDETRNSMQKISFFLLLCLMAYVIMNGAS